MEYQSSEREHEKHVNLLLLEGENGIHHYVCITSMLRFVAHRSKHRFAAHVCNSCLHPFENQQSYDNHLPYCLKHSAQMITYPNLKNEKECTVKFRAYRKQYKLPFYLVADSEAFLSPSSENKSTHVINKHQILGFACHRVTDNQYKTTQPSLAEMM